MNKARRDELNTLLFSLTDEGVDFRNRWRSIAQIVVWLVLSGISMLSAVFFTQATWQTAVVIGMSLVKYAPLMAVVYSLARKMASLYLDDIFELHDEELASQFLEEVTFGYGLDKITINEGRVVEKDETSPIILIGGPGAIQVNLDSVALLEKVNGEPEVIYPRKDAWKLGRFERIREIGKFDEVGKREYAIINLRDQFISGLTVKSRTKDGIPIEAQDIKVIFSILRKPKPENPEAPDSSYLFDEEAVKALVYNQTIITPVPSTPSAVSFPWDTSAIPLITSELENLITSHTLSEILVTIGQKEIDNTSNNEQTITQMRVELTGQQTTLGSKKAASAPSFKSRSRITAQFFEKPFQDKAAAVGVYIEWIDIGTWQLPSSLILDKHKEAWNLARENAKKAASVERLRKRFETAEIVSLIENVVIRNYERPVSGSYRSSYSGSKEKEADKEWDAFIAANPDLKGQLNPRESRPKDSTATATALEILKAFRKELLAGKELIEKENRPFEEKQADLLKIEKALFDISHLTHHWIRKS